RSGLVARVVPAASLMDETMKVAETIAAMSLPSVLAAKEAVNRSFETSLAEGVRFERRVFHALFATEDQKEGMAAFVEKRPPKFRNEWGAASRSSFPHADHAHQRRLGGIEAAAPRHHGRQLLCLEERADDRSRDERGLRLRARRACIGRDRCLEPHHADEATLGIERGGAGKAGLRRRVERIAPELRRH